MARLWNNFTSSSVRHKSLSHLMKSGQYFTSFLQAAAHKDAIALKCEVISEKTLLETLTTLHCKEIAEACRIHLRC